jgi:hypothetical protein
MRLAVAGLTVAALTAGVSVWASTGGGPTGHGPAAFAIEKLPTGPVRIRIVDTDVAAAEMTKQLHEQGLNITVTTVAATSQIVGSWLEASYPSGSNPADQAALAAQFDSSSTIDVPAGLLTSGVTLTFGRATRPGEKYVVGGIRNALRPSGPLFCMRLAGAEPSVAVQKLTAAGYTVHFNATGNWRSSTSAPPEGEVVYAYVWDQVMGIAGTTKDVYVTVKSPDAASYEGSLRLQWPPGSAAPDYSSCPAS